MPFIKLNEQQFPLRTGDVRVGAGADADIRLPGADGPEAQAVISLAPDNSVVVRRGGAAAVVKVNGVQLGAEPSPLIHGDKIEIGGTELTFGDDKKGGSTQYISAMSVPAGFGAGAPARVNKPTTGTGGRLVSLVDGREYQVTGTGLVIGRDPTCDVVVPSNEVSRRHAEIVSRPDGYVVNDMSTNGVLVNGERVQQSRVLGRADVLKVGNEEFRFYADAAAAPAAAAPAPVAAPETLAAVPTASAEAGLLPDIDFEPIPEPVRAPPPPAPAPAAPKAPPTPTPVASQPPVPPPAPRPAPQGAGGTAVIAPMARPAAPSRPAAEDAGLAPQGAPADGPLLGTLEIVNEGMLKGRRFEVRRPLVHVGRGMHNDVQIADDSVSDSHAKLQKRDGGWFVVDMDSTNGTYVGGRRITGEAPLVGVPDVRFGGVKMRFTPIADAETEAKGTRAIAGVTLDQAKKLAEARSTGTTPPSSPAMPPAPVPAPVAVAPDAPAKGGVPAIAWVVLLVVVAALAYFFLTR